MARRLDHAVIAIRMTIEMMVLRFYLEYVMGDKYFGGILPLTAPMCQVRT